MELKKVGYCYASMNDLILKLDNYFNEYQNNHFYIFNVETNKGINYQLIIKRNKINFDFNKKVYFSIFGYSAAALAKFQQHTNITPLSIREYNDIKGGAPYQIFKSEV
jgi:outer membrane protein assembly factor BamE (lipoprotein component of BamABCDE complex)